MKLGSNPLLTNICQLNTKKGELIQYLRREGDKDIILETSNCCINHLVFYFHYYYCTDRDRAKIFRAVEISNEHFEYKKVQIIKQL